MNPIRPCPHCGKDVDFHEDELEGLRDGTTICLECGFEMEQTRMILEIAHGHHPELVDEILSRDEEGGDDEDSDDDG